MMARRRRPAAPPVGRVLRYAIAGAIALGLATSLYWLTIEPGEVLPSRAAGLAWWLLPALVGATLLRQALGFLRWHYLLRAAGVLVPTRASLAVYLAGFAMLVTPGRIGMVVKAFLLRRRHRTRLRPVIAVVLMEWVHDLAALGILFFAAGRGVGRPGPISLAALLAGVGALAWVLLRGVSAEDDARPLPRLLGPRAVIIALALSVGAAAVAAAAFLVAVQAVGGHLATPAGVAVFAGAGALGQVSLVPAELGITGTLWITGLVGSGLARDQAVLAVLLVRVAGIWLPILVGSVVLTVLARRFVWPDRYLTLAHFDDLAPDYADEIPAHMRAHFLDKKLTPMLAVLAAGERLTGADLGCGQAWYAAELMRRSGHRVLALDLSTGQLSQAQRAQDRNPTAARPFLVRGDLARLPCREGALDFAYSINVLHHLGHRDRQEEALREIRRALRPDGVFFLHEMNVTSPVVRLYLAYLFPLVKRIDEGTEEWLWPRRLPRIPGLELTAIHYFTFLPDFLPRRLLRRLAPVERWLERSRFRWLGAHYLACFARREEGATGGSGLGRGGALRSGSRQE